MIMLRAQRRNISKVKSSYNCHKNQNSPIRVSITNHHIISKSRSIKRRCYFSIKVINLNKLLSFAQYSLILFLCCSSTIHQTETNTRNIFKNKVDLNWRENNQRLIELRTSRGVEKFQEINSMQTKPEGSKFKFKVSPTRIKFSSANDRIERKMISIPGNERLSRDHESSVNRTIVSFSDKRYKSPKQMAPAYEFWPDTNENRRYVISLEESSRNNYDSVSNSKLSNLDWNRLDQTYPNINLDLNSLRGLLPKPLASKASSISSNRVLRERSTPGGESEDESPDIPNKPEEVVDSGDENVDEKSDKNLDRDNSSESDPDYSNKSNDDDRIFVQNPNHRHLNFQVFGSQETLKRVQRRKLKESQIYPPGDPNILYADALLVYVKDFNRYIKS